MPITDSPLLPPASSRRSDARAAARRPTTPPSLVASPQRLQADLSLRDLTDPTQGHHAIQSVLKLAVGALTASWPSAVLTWRDAPIVAVEDNYDRLGYSDEATARDSRYTRYVSDTCMLRSHTSAMMPAVLRHLAAEQRDRRRTVGDVLCICPGLVYRRDVIDRLHTGTPHQVDLWRVRQGAVRDDDLREMIGLVVGAALPGLAWRANPTRHPYTEHGLEVEAQVDGEWVEILECGLIAPAVLARAGLDPEQLSGLAMGIGLDRVVMVRKRLPDIRLLRSADRRVATQLLNLEPYHPVSNQPAIRRDLSVAVDGDLDDELLGDIVRESVGDEADSIESVEILSETPATELPDAARRRLGIHDGQKNWLMRVTLRHVDRTLTDAEANHLRDRIYDAVHRGAPSA